MVTGDHIETAKYYALQAGIVTRQDINREYCVMTGEEFREKVQAEIVRDEYSGDVTVRFKDRQVFMHVKKNCKVLARATEEDRLIISCGIKTLGGLTCIVGDSVYD